MLLCYNGTKHTLRPIALRIEHALATHAHLCMPSHTLRRGSKPCMVDGTVEHNKMLNARRKVRESDDPIKATAFYLQYFTHLAIDDVKAWRHCELAFWKLALGCNQCFLRLL